MASTCIYLILFAIFIHCVLGEDNENKTAEAVQSAEHSNSIEKARRLVQNFLKDKQNEFCPGLVISVSMKGEQKWLEGFGVANIENNVTMTDDAVMQIGSISKSFTAGLALRLVQDGKLDFDLPIRNYLSVEDFPDKMWNGSHVNITLRQLLQMTAGIPHGITGDLFLMPEIGKCLHCVNQTEHLIFVRDKELEFEPGTNFSYSNFGYELAGAVIESVLENKTFDAAMNEMIKNILKLNKTAIADTEMITPHVASFYYTNMTSNMTRIYNSGLWGDVFLNDLHAAGGIMSTMTDLLTYGQIWLDAYNGRSEHFLTQSMVVNAWTPSQVDHASYGMGWIFQNLTGDRPSGSQVVWHNGETYGCRSILAIYPESEIIVAASANLDSCTVDEFVLNNFIADIFANSNNVTQP